MHVREGRTRQPVHTGGTGIEKEVIVRGSEVAEEAVNISNRLHEGRNQVSGYTGSGSQRN